MSEFLSRGPEGFSEIQGEKTKTGKIHVQSIKNRTMKCEVAVASPPLATAEGPYLGHLEPSPGHEQRR